MVSKVENNFPKFPEKQAEAKRDGVINPQNYNFNQFRYGTFKCSQNATHLPKSTVELGYMCPRGLTGPPLYFDPFRIALNRQWYIMAIWTAKHLFSSDLQESVQTMKKRCSSFCKSHVAFYRFHIFSSILNIVSNKIQNAFLNRRWFSERNDVLLRTDLQKSCVFRTMRCPIYFM